MLDQSLQEKSTKFEVFLRSREALFKQSFCPENAEIFAEVSFMYYIFHWFSKVFANCRGFKSNRLSAFALWKSQKNKNFNISSDYIFAKTVPEKSEKFSDISKGRLLCSFITSVALLDHTNGTSPKNLKIVPLALLENVFKFFRLFLGGDKFSAADIFRSPYSLL